MKTSNTQPLPTSGDARSKKVSALKAVIHGDQVIESLKEYRKLPEWAIFFTIVIFSDGSYQCVEFNRIWNWYEEDTFEQGGVLWVTIERFRQLETLWQQTPKIDKVGSYMAKYRCDKCERITCQHTKRVLHSVEQIGSKFGQNMRVEATDTSLSLLPSFDQFLDRVSDFTHIFTYTMHINNELCESKIQPLWNTKDKE